MTDLTKLDENSDQKGILTKKFWRLRGFDTSADKVLGFQKPFL